MGDEDVAVGGLRRHRLGEVVGHLSGGADERVPGRDPDDEFPGGEVLGLGQGTPFGDRGLGVLDVFDAALGDRFPGRGHIGQRAVRVEAREIAIPDAFEERDRSGLAVLLEGDLAGALLGLCRSVAEDDGDAGEDLEIVLGPTVAGQAGLHVGIELPTRFRVGVAGEDDIGRSGGEVAAGVGVTGLEDHRVAAGQFGQIEAAGDVEEVAAVGELPVPTG